MREQTQAKTVIRYKDYDGDYVYVSTAETSDYDDLYINDAYTFEEAMDFDGFGQDFIVRTFDQFIQEAGDRDCELVRISVKTTVDDLMENDETYKELRQKTALAKLTEREIKALNLVPIAVYIKTKYHNA